jgi:hypothetical protein
MYDPFYDIPALAGAASAIVRVTRNDGSELDLASAMHAAVYGGCVTDRAQRNVWRSERVIGSLDMKFLHILDDTDSSPYTVPTALHARSTAAGPDVRLNIASAQVSYGAPVLSCDNACYPGVSCVPTPTTFQCGACPQGMVRAATRRLRPALSCRQVGNGSVCENFNPCGNNPCFFGVTCTDDPPPSLGYVCGACPPGFTGNGSVCACK